MSSTKWRPFVSALISYDWNGDLHIDSVFPKNQNQPPYINHIDIINDVFCTLCRCLQMQILMFEAEKLDTRVSFC